MKVAFLFSGQYRKIPKSLFKNSLSNLVKGLDYSIYSFCWKEIGESLNHSKFIPKIEKLDDIDIVINELFNEFNLKKSSFESFIDFQNNISDIHKSILNNTEYHIGTIHSLPQIYSMAKCYQLMKNDLRDYDLIFRCRFDSLFLHPLNLYPLDSISCNNNIYNINFGRAYYPKRIYDIFFGGSPKAMSFLNDLWTDLPKFINDNFDNGLDKRDACRLLYIGATLNKVNCKSFDTRICDIYRPSDETFLEKYIIKSHFSVINLSKRNFIAYKYFYNWLLKRKMINYEIIKIFLLFIILFPFSYIKRIKYFKYFSF